MPQKGTGAAKKKKRKRLNDLSNAGAFFISLLAIFCFTLVICLGYVFINAVTVVAGDPVINLESARNNQNQTRSSMPRTPTESRSRFCVCTVRKTVSGSISTRFPSR